MIWQALVTGVIVAIGFAIYTVVVKKMPVASALPQIATVGAIAAVISFVLRLLF